MRNLSFISLVLLLLTTGCTTIRPAGLKKCSEEAQSGSLERSPYKDRFEKMLFKVSMTIRTDRLTGLMLFKKMPDSSIQVVFTNEIGMTFFNFILKEGSFETGYCFEPMNKKALISMFRTCFELMLKYESDEKGRMFLCDPAKGNTVIGGRSGRYYTWAGVTAEEPRTAFINGMTNPADKTLITFSNFSSDVPGSVTILNPFINLKIRLEMISF
jgi:hypothetical protein